MQRPFEFSTSDSGDAAPAVSPAELDRAIGEVIQQRKYSWRMPREAAPDEPAKANFLTTFFEKVGAMLRDAIRGFFDWLGRMLAKLFRGFRPSGSLPKSNLDWAMLSQMLLYLLVAVVLSALAILLYRLWRNRRPKEETIQAEAIAVVPDVADESVGAEQLPEDGWTRLARELLARGEFRLALRAFYLASLAHLAERNLISLARFKSNADYRRELARRAHSFPALLGTFEDLVRVFDRVWYGTHAADGELVAQFASGVEKIKAGG
jgi:ABC-type multidrug transport system fused ATPase/permease subunit